MESRLSFGKIHIIEWLWDVNPETNEPDRRTGTEVYRAAEQVIAESGTRMDLILHRVSSRSSFLARLKRIEKDFRATRRIPLLQIETHGDADGIGLTDDNGLTWPELSDSRSTSRQRTCRPGFGRVGHDVFSRPGPSGTGRSSCL